MALNNFISHVWAARLLENLRKNLVYTNDMVINRDYEGEVQAAGDTVRINAIGPVTVSDYTKNTNLSDPETLNDAQTTLVITQAKAFNFAIDDVDKIQQFPKLMDAAMSEAAYALADTADQYVAGLMAAGAATLNLIGTDAAPKTDLATAGKAYEYLVDLGVKLSDRYTPENGRWAIVPPWFYGYLLKDDRFVRAGTSVTDRVLAQGIVGEAAGFTIMKSHNVINSSLLKYKIIAGVRSATTYADEVNQVEAYRPEKRFGDAVKGLQLYGAKVVRPNQLAVLTANPT